MFPVAGDYFGKGGKLAARHGDKVVTAGKHLTEGGGVFKRIFKWNDNAAQVARRNAGSCPVKNPGRGVRQPPDVPTTGGSQYRGGRHSRTKKPAGDGLESHHMPADSTTSIPRERGPAIQMDPVDHKMTSSHSGQGPTSKQYRDNLKEMIDQGRNRNAMAMEIWDVKRAAREGSGDSTKYNDAIREMLNYAKDSGFLKKCIPPK